MATTVAAVGAATVLGLGSSTCTLTLNNPTIVSSTTSLTLFNTVATTVNAFGAAATLAIGSSAGTVTIANPTVATGTTNLTLFNTNATTVAAFGAATTLGLGSSTGTLTLSNPTIVSSTTSLTLFNTVATTVNAFGAATTLSLGASSGTTTVNNNLTVTGNLTVNGTTTTVNSTTVSVDDINIILGDTASPTDVTASGGGITLKGATDKTITWSDATGWQTDEAIATSRYFKLTTAGTSANAMLAIPTATYRSGKIVLQVSNSTSYRIMEMLFMHDGTTVTFNENYTVATEMQSATTNTTFSGSISAGTLTIYATCSSGTASIKGHATLFKV